MVKRAIFGLPVTAQDVWGVSALLSLCSRESGEAPRASRSPNSGVLAPQCGGGCESAPGGSPWGGGGLGSPALSGAALEWQVVRRPTQGHLGPRCSPTAKGGLWGSCHSAGRLLGGRVSAASSSDSVPHPPQGLRGMTGRGPPSPLPS